MRWIIGDIHGMLRPLGTLLDAIHRTDPDPEFLFCGDYVNRGPDSRGVIESLVALDNARFARGNHDDVFDLILNGTSFAKHPNARDPLGAFQWFMHYGLDTTLLSYGIDYAWLESAMRRPHPDHIKKIVDVIPATHRNFIRSLQPVLEDEDLFVTHATWDVTQPTDDPPLTHRLAVDAKYRHMILWGRYSDQDITTQKAWQRVGFFGHTPVANYAPLPGQSRQNVPIFGPQLALLDTGAALGAEGRLTAYCPETRTYLQSDHFGKLLPSTDQ